MTTNPVGAPSLPWSSGVEGVAAANGVDRYLLPIHEITRETFPDARRVTVAVEDDPEFEEDWRIVYAVETALPVARVVQAVQQWYQLLFERCPPTAACFFRLGFKVVS